MDKTIVSPLKKRNWIPEKKQPWFPTWETDILRRISISRLGMDYTSNTSPMWG